MTRSLVSILALWTLFVDLAFGGNWVTAPAGPPSGLIERLDQAHWFASGAKSPGRVVYVFSDPDCPFCNDLWKAMKAARAPDVQIRTLLVAVIDADSRGKDAAILESPDPAAAYEKHERGFGSGGLAPKTSVAPATSETLSTNESLMRSLHIFGTPGLVYQDANGAVKVLAGMPDEKQLQAIVGKRVDAVPGGSAAPSAAQRRSVVELFTSQGCSSCPPADALVGKLSTDPALLVLSFHVNYWDNTSWRDSFSSQVSTDRQYSYARALRESTVFTPQLIVGGTQSVIASREADVLNAMKQAATGSAVTVDLSKLPDGSYNAILSGDGTGADLWEARFVRHAVVRVRGGENGGRELETFNNVVEFRRIGSFATGPLVLPPLKQPEDGLALIVQRPSAGPILGAAAL